MARGNDDFNNYVQLNSSFEIGLEGQKSTLLSVEELPIVRNQASTILGRFRFNRIFFISLLIGSLIILSVGILLTRRKLWNN